MSRLTQVLLILLLLWAVSYTAASLMEKGSFGNKIAVIPVTGTIMVGGYDSVITAGFSSDMILEKIKEVEEDKGVKGVIIELNTGGGTVVGSKEIADAVKKLRTKKPVVALIRDIGASGGYWIASSADKVVADPLSLTGSIGVMGSYLQFSGLFDKYGVEYERLVGGKYKDMAAPFKEPTEEELALLQKSIDKVHDYFIKDVALNRKLSEGEVRRLATGEPFLGIEAKELGLVDELGNLDIAVNLTKQLAGIEDASVVRMKEHTALFNLFSGFSSKAAYYMGRGIGAELKADEGLLIRA